MMQPDIHTLIKNIFIYSSQLLCYQRHFLESAQDNFGFEH